MSAELFEIVEGGLTTRYTSGNAAVVKDGETFLPRTIGRGSMVSSSEMSKASLEVSLLISDPLAEKWLANVLDRNIYLTLYKTQDNGVTFTVEWKGRMSGMLTSGQYLKLAFDSNFAKLKRAGLRKRFQRSCPYALYGVGCGLNPTDFRVAGVITIKVDLTLTIPEAGAFDDHYFSGGMIEDSGGRLRAITSHVGTSITISRTLNGLEDSNSVYLFPGCDRSLTTCHVKFSNSRKFGGCPYIPTKNPFSGISVV